MTSWLRLEVMKIRRSRKIALVSHCILNTNAKIEGTASYPAALQQVVGLLLAHHYGIIQLPCPELRAMGLRRWGQVVEQYANPFFTESVRSMLVPTLMEIQEYVRNGYRVDLLIGIDKSPSCGVNLTCSGDWGGEIGIKKLTESMVVKGEGVMIRVLRQEMEKLGIPLTMVGVDEDNLSLSIEAIKQAMLRAGS